VEPIATVIIVNYEGADHLTPCLDAVERLRGVDFETIVVDNASTDGSWRAADDRPAIRLIRNHRNVGFGAACNQAARIARGQYLAFLNFDSVPAPDWLDALVAAAAEAPDAAALQGIVLTEDGGVNTAGNRLHYLGFSWAPATPLIPSGAPYEIAAGSGASLLVRRADFEDVGGFWELMFLYCEDTDLSWRLRLRGRRVLAAPAARSVHDYSFARNADKMFHLERNRSAMVLANYERWTLIKLAPMLLAAEVAVLAVAARDRWLVAKLRAIAAVARALPEVARHRRAVQRTRTATDRQLASLLESRLGPELGAAAFGRALELYGRAVGLRPTCTGRVRRSRAAPGDPFVSPRGR
jgi:N-acetylglucosaminyl-diphospho-decaprenol L-rhamnosyltransferase